MTTLTTNTLGWFRDPYLVHEFRYFSEGHPTKLVRDGGLESFDPPPDVPMPVSLVPAASGASPWAGPADMRRADDAEREAPYDRRAACQKATSSIVRFGSSD
ncbi:MAG TPA: hypothetical protein VII76_15505 [Acidimicrobiales bacterium]